MRALLLAALLALPACTRERLERIPLACVAANQIPPEVERLDRLPEDARQAADMLGLTVLALRENERILRALLSACAR